MISKLNVGDVIQFDIFGEGFPINARVYKEYSNNNNVYTLKYIFSNNIESATPSYWHIDNLNKLNLKIINSSVPKKIKKYII